MLSTSDHLHPAQLLRLPVEMEWGSGNTPLSLGQKLANEWLEPALGEVEAGELEECHSLVSAGFKLVHVTSLLDQKVGERGLQSGDVPAMLHAVYFNSDIPIR